MSHEAEQTQGKSRVVGKVVSLPRLEEAGARTEP
jgi:hypothetical protein